MYHIYINHFPKENLRGVNLPVGIIFYSELTGAELTARNKSRQGARQCRASPGQGLFFINHHMEFVMNKFISAVKAFAADEDGVTAIEYALIAALIGVGVITVGGELRDAIVNTFQEVVDALNGAATP